MNPVNPADDKLRECSVCPPWVVRCAHFDGGQQIVFMMLGGVPGTFAVHGPGVYDMSVEGGRKLNEDHFCNCWQGRSEEALAEFHRREAQLLGREVSV